MQFYLFLISITFFLSLNVVAEDIQLLIVDNYKLSPADDRIQPLRDNLTKLKNNYGIEITKNVLDHFILDITPKGPEHDYLGFNLAANYDNPLIKSSFHTPFYALLKKEISLILI